MPTFNWLCFKEAVRQLKAGKRLPDAVYLHRSALSEVAAELRCEVTRAASAAIPDDDWRIVKLHENQFAISFLSYPEFNTDPHPALAEATKINLNTGTVVRSDYRGRVNPPILHRKETFLPPNDPRIPAFAALTKQEEEAGLYRDLSRIGLRTHWQSLLKKLKVTHDGHRLVPLSQQPCQRESADLEKVEVVRHRTAIKRYDI
jgi:DNA phosphorothioation-associated putative methyltransferase